jgi:hypothetical protein
MAIRRTHRAMTASSGYSALRTRLDCHVTMWLAMTALWEYIRKLGRHPPIPVPACHCEERSDVAIQRNHPATHRIAPASHVTHHTGLPRPAGLAMTAQGNTPVNRNASHLAHSRPSLSLRGAQRRGNPAKPLGNTRTRLSCRDEKECYFDSDYSRAGGFAWTVFRAKICILGVLGEWFHQG